MIEWALDTETVKGKAILVTLAGPGGKTVALEWPKSFQGAARWIAGYADGFMTYNMDYDARALLKFLPRKSLIALYRDETVKVRDWRVTYKPGRSFRVSFGPAAGGFALYDLAVF